MTEFSIHLAPNARWLILVVLAVAAAGLAAWAYRFGWPPLPATARRVLPVLRALALVALLALLAQPVLERARAGAAARLVVLVDRSLSMDLPSEGPGSKTRTELAEAAVTQIRSAWRGRAEVRVVPFAAGLPPDSAHAPARGVTALGSALAALPNTEAGQDLDGIVVVSDGVVNAGEDPVAVARSLGMPVHGVWVGRPGARDRTITEIESSTQARVGEATPVRVHVATSETAGAPIVVRLLDGDRVLGRATLVSPGAGADAVAELRVIPSRPGLAVWRATLDSLAGERTTRNNAREVAIEVAPGKLGVTVLSGALSWDLGFVRRAWLGDSGVSVHTRVRERTPGRAAEGWRALERGVPEGAPGPEDLRGQAVVVLDALNPAELGDAMDAALATFVRNGGGLLVLGGSDPGVARLRGGALGAELALDAGPEGQARTAAPAPTADGREVLAWDDDPVRGDKAWREAAPLSEVSPVAPRAGDRVLLASQGAGPPIMLVRRVGRGQVLVVNGAGLWRWSLSGNDDLGGERGRRLWRRVLRWLSEPVQGEPLRVRPERWLTAAGETTRLFASLQDDAFKPVAGASVEGDLATPGSRARRVTFTPGASGAYVTSLDELPPGRYRLSARATRGGRELGRASTEFAVDRWSLEEAKSDPDSTTLQAMAAAAGGHFTAAAEVGRWARALPSRGLARARGQSMRLWESPWIFAVVVGALSIEWAWRRRRGLP